MRGRALGLSRDELFEPADLDRRKDMACALGCLCARAPIVQALLSTRARATVHGQGGAADCRPVRARDHAAPAPPRARVRRRTVRDRGLGGRRGRRGGRARAAHAHDARPARHVRAIRAASEAGGRDLARRAPRRRRRARPSDSCQSRPARAWQSCSRASSSTRATAGCRRTARWCRRMPLGQPRAVRDQFGGDWLGDQGASALARAIQLKAGLCVSSTSSAMSLAPR